MSLNQSLRIIFRNKTYSLLNIAGLAIGIACAALIFLWVENEMTFNDFPKQKQLYKVFQNQTHSGEIFSFGVAPNPLAAVLKEEVPGVKNVMRYSDNMQSVFSLNEKMLYETGAYADASIFDMLDIQFIRGNAATAFEGTYPLVITEEMAERFFGKENPVGKTLKKDNGEEYSVTAVIKKPRNSSFGFSWIIPFQQHVKEWVANVFHDAETSWDSNWMDDYVELGPSADLNQINGRIINLLKEKQKDTSITTTLFLYPINKLKLYEEFRNGQPTGSGYVVRYVRLFFGIAIVILIIVCINFMNLSTARSQKRILELGVRKTFGAKRMRLIRQFMSEAGIITLISLLLAIVLIAITLPQFNNMTGKQLTLGLENPFHWIGFLCIGLICSVMAGSYPAFFLSSFPPIDVLRKLAAKRGSGVIRLRQGLVVFQFAVSLILIICTTFIYLQVLHTKNRSLGMNVEQILMLDANKDIQTHYESLKQELLGTGVVENAGVSNQTMLEIWSNGGGWKWQGKPDNIDPLVSFVAITDDLFPTLQITLRDGRNFNRNIDDNTHNVIINKAFADLMGEDGRIGGQLWRNDVGKEEKSVIIGIVNDFVFNNMYGKTPLPILFKLGGGGNNLFIRIKTGDMQAAIQKIERVMKRFDPNHPFGYMFMDDQFNQYFQSELLVGKLAGLFAILAIFISCLGLFGLTAFSAEQRTREIGIRKVLGATVPDIVELLGRNFMLLIGISFVIAIPLAWWIILDWLQSYEYRIRLNWWVFAGSGVLVVFIVIMTVGFHAVKAATANPVKAIKTE